MNFRKLKLSFPAFVFISFLWIDSYGQDNLNNLINQIKMDCEKVNKDAKTFKIIEEDIEGQSSEGGILKRYYKDKDLKKAEFTLFGETGQSTSEYYFQNGELIFVKERTEIYEVPIYMGKTETASLENDEMYFKNQILVRWLDNDGKIVDQVKYLEKQIEIMNDLKIINQDRKDK
ncbi:MAG TPA: hypothetical protein VF144_16900 [Chitinophagaceae bacterium]